MIAVAGGPRHPVQGGGLYARALRGERDARAAGLRLLLVPLAGVFGLVVRIRNALYDGGRWPCRVRRAPVPVISVGNLTVGGTGKSLVAVELARRAAARGLRPAILGRGYGGEVHGASAGCGDEALEQLEALGGAVPVYCDPARVRGAHRAARKGAGLVILDDGFQHRRLHREADLVCIDALQPLGYGRLLPRGLLREPVAALRRAHLVVLTRCDQVQPPELEELQERLRGTGFAGSFVRTAHQPTVLDSLSGAGSRPPESLAGERVVLISGLGNPEAFERSVQALGAQVVTHVARPDHHRWTLRDLREVASWLAPGVQVVATGKDAVKLSPLLAGGPWWALRVRLQVLEGAELLEALLRDLPVKPAGHPVDSSGGDKDRYLPT